jgi:hypothetical protein
MFAHAVTLSGAICRVFLATPRKRAREVKSGIGGRSEVWCRLISTMAIASNAHRATR